MSASQDLLAVHPSVQDLDVDSFKLNARKAHYHSLVINNGPLHAPSEHGKNSVVRKNVPKGQTIKVMRSTENLHAAAKALGAEQQQQRMVVPPALRPAATNASKTAAAKSTQLPPPKPPSMHGSATGSGSKLTSERLAAVSAQQQQDGGPTSVPMPVALPPVLAGGLPRPRRQESIVSSKVSFVATDAESFSVYSCSCCNAKVPSSYGGGRNQASASEYDNLTSISQRTSNHPSQTASVSSTKLRKLEGELQREREDRLKTQHELDVIQQRQRFLLSKLSKEEQDQLAKLMDGGA